jgi:hypothetical protein
MARSFTTILVALAAAMAIPGSVEAPAPHVPVAANNSSGLGPSSELLTAEQKALVHRAMERFDAQGLELPEIRFVFHDDLFPCHGHKGRYHSSTATLEMCSMDPITMLHELAHAWANESLSERAKEDFLRSR